MKLKNKFAVIVGGVVGIGAAISKRFGREGCNLIISYHGESEKGEISRLEGALKKNKIKYYFENLDVLKKDHIKAFFNKVKEITQVLDIAINNAGAATENNFVDLAEKEWDFVMDVNAKGMFLCCQEEARIMIKQNFGKIINTASLASKTGVQYIVHYSASKYAVLGLTFTMAKELAVYNINVNAVCPGIVLTGMKERNWHARAQLCDLGYDEIVEKDRAKIPLGRFATPDDIANMFYFLALEDSDYITGQGFNVDGGLENH